MLHYDIPLELRADAENGELTEPCFIGQGWSYHVGSDTYGGYVTFIGVNSKNSLYFGLADAETKFERDWTDGSQTCVMPRDRTPDSYVIKYRNKWWPCDKDGVRMKGRMSFMPRYSWNGAFSYRDPSF